MTTPAIQVRGLGKKFRIGARQGRHKRLTETVTDLALAPLRRLQRLGKPVPPGEEIWALKDVSFDVMPGEVVGVIGRNGAGKSTLLKILSRITEPTTGEVLLRGRVGSLLEVGTGFHPELTGRENIYLNGAILGMKRAEIRAKFDEIVAFAEIDKFLDTPVKRYSSGMYVRLAFAVAAHLEPEILLVDEVLAVGDAQFQKKCLGKMGDVARGGRTVLFVSHNMIAVSKMCSRCILLQNGTLLSKTDPEEAVRHYLNCASDGATTWLAEDSTPPLRGGRIRRVSLVAPDGFPIKTITSSDAFGLEIDVEIAGAIPNALLSVVVANSYEHPLFSTSIFDSRIELPPQAGAHRTRVHFPRGVLRAQQYFFAVSLYDSERTFDHVQSPFTIDIKPVNTLDTAIPGGRMGDIFLHCQWDPFTSLLGTHPEPDVR